MASSYLLRFPTYENLQIVPNSTFLLIVAFGSWETTLAHDSTTSVAEAEDTSPTSQDHARDPAHEGKFIPTNERKAIIENWSHPKTVAQMARPSPHSNNCHLQPFSIDMEYANMNGKTVLITGGASGLGLSTAQAAARAGAQVIIADLKPAGEDINQLIVEGHQVYFIQFNAVNWDSQLSMFRRAAELAKPGAINAVAMFAAVDNQPNIIDLVIASSKEQICKPDTSNLEVNLIGVFYSSYLALYYLQHSAQRGTERTDSSLLFISSLAGYLDDSHNTTYTASKFGTRGLFRSLRGRAGAELGIRCNLIAPWAMKTPMTDPLLERMEQHGIKEGKGVTFADHRTLVEVVFKCLADCSISGQSRFLAYQFFVRTLI